MSAIDIVSNGIREYTNLGLRLFEDSRSFLVSKEIPLDDRWDLMVDLQGAGLLGTRRYASEVLHSINAKRPRNRQLSLYDDFHIDRHSTKMFADMHDQLVEYLAEKFVISQEDINEWREYILEQFAYNGYAGFELDW